MEQEDCLGAIAGKEYENERLRQELELVKRQVLRHYNTDNGLNLSDGQIGEQAIIALRESEEKFRTLADNISQLAWMADAEGWIFWYNQRWFEYTGETMDMLGWGWTKVHHPDHIDRVTEHFKQSLISGEMWEDTFPIKRKDGVYRWFLSRALPIRGENNNIIRWFGTNTDITDQLQTKNEMAELTSRLRTILENINDGVVVYSPEGELLEINRAASEIAGWKEGVPGTKFRVDTTVYALYDENDQLIETKDRPVQKAIRGENFKTQVFRVVNLQTKEQFYLDYSAIPVFNSNGNLAFAVITIRDITQQKKVQIEKELAGLELQKSHELMESVMRIAAHDLRGPIGTIGSGLELIEKVNDPERKFEFLSQIKVMMKRLERTVIGLLDVLKVQSVENLEFTIVSFDEILADILLDVQDKLKAINGTVRFNFKNAPTVCYIMPFVESILKNMISNAIKYCSDERKLEIEINSYYENGFVVLKIKDNGMGMDLNLHKLEIFQPFKRLTDKAHGVGVGLYLIKKILEKNGGTINVRSEVNVGTTFYCFFKEYDKKE